MFFSPEATDLIVRVAQMLGIALGLGAQTVMLVAYMQAIRDGIIDNEEAQFARAVRRVLRSSLVLIVLSGAASIALDMSGDNVSVFTQPAYLFKWLLILIVLALSFVPVQRLMLEGVAEGLAGGTWYVLFLVHMLAPVARWANLLTLYAVWMLGFSLCWAVLVISLKGKNDPAGGDKRYPAPAFRPAPPAASMPKPPPVFPFAAKPPPPISKIIPPPVPAPAPTPPPPLVQAVKPIPPPPPKPTVPAPPANLPVLEQKHILQTLPQPNVDKKNEFAVVKDDQNPWLPAIQIMPKTQSDADKQNPLPPPPAGGSPK